MPCLARFLAAVVGAVALLGPLPCGACQEPPESRIDFAVKQVPVCRAVEQLFAGTAIRLEFAPALPNPPVTVDLKQVTRPTALRILLRLGGLTGTQVAGVVTINQAGPGVARVNGDGTITGSYGFGLSAVTGFSVAPGGAQLPNTTSTGIFTTRRTGNGQTTQLGEIGHGTRMHSSSRPPFLPGGSRTTSSVGTSSATFITTTILPDPLERNGGRRPSR